MPRLQDPGVEETILETKKDDQIRYLEFWRGHTKEYVASLEAKLGVQVLRHERLSYE